MTVTVEPVAGDTLVRIVGDLEHDTRAEARTAFEDVAALDGTVSLDLAGIDFMDSTGLALLVNAYRAVERRGGRLRVVAMSDRVDRLLTITGTHALLTAG